MNKRRTLFALGGIVLVGLCLLIVGGVIAYRGLLPSLIVGRRDAARPAVGFLMPLDGQQLALGSPIPVQVEAEVQSGQVALIQLWADDELAGEKTGSSARLDAQWGWLPLRPGEHTLVARAFNQDGDSGVAVVRVTVVEAADVDSDGIPDSADTCPDRPGLPSDGCPPGMTGGVAGDGDAQQVADAWVGPEVEGAGVVRTVGEPGVIQGGQQRPEFDGSDFPPGERTIEENCLLCGLREQEEQGRYGQVDDSVVGVELEVLSLRTAEGLSDVACYAQLQGEPWERIPSDQDEFFAPLGGGLWNVDAYLGGENGRLFAVEEAGAVSLRARCYGRLGDMLAASLHLGEVARTHGPQDWNGQTFVARGQEGANWFDVSYRICPGSCEQSLLPPPYNLQVRRQEGVSTSYVLTWRWDGDASAIDGFEIYRDGSLIDFSGSTFAFLSQASAEPPCSREYRFEVRAVSGAQRSAPSSPAFSAATESCRDRNELEIANVTLPTAERADLTVDLNYWYEGDHGRQVHVFALPLQAGQPPRWASQAYPEFHNLFSLGTAAVTPGRGTVTVHVYYGWNEPLTTDGLRLVMMEDGGEWFYMRDVPLDVQWYPSGPDLTIVSVDPFHAPIDEEGYNTIAVLVRNIGYARVGVPRLSARWNAPYAGSWDWEPPASALRGQIAPMQEVAVIWPRVAPTILAGPIEFMVDPDNGVAELDESNNTYAGLGLTIYRVRLVEATGPLSWGNGDTGLREGQRVPFDEILGPAGQFTVRAGDRGYGFSFKGGGVSHWILDTWLYSHVVGFHAAPSCRPMLDACTISFEQLLLGCATFECDAREAGNEDWTGSASLSRDFCGGTDYNVDRTALRVCSTGDECEDVADVVRYVNPSERIITVEADEVAVVAFADEDLHVSFTLWDIDSNWDDWGREAWRTMCEAEGIIPASQLIDLPQEFELRSECRVRVRVLGQYGEVRD